MLRETLDLISEGGWPALAVALGLAVVTHLPVGARLVVAPGRPVAVLVVATLVVAAGLLLHGVWRVPLARGMPARLLKHKPNVACPQDKVQESKDLDGEKRISSPHSCGVTAQPDGWDPAWSLEKAGLLPVSPSSQICQKGSSAVEQTPKFTSLSSSSLG